MESNEERVRREEQEKEDADFTNAIDDSYKLVRKLAIDNNALSEYSRSDSLVENLHLALIMVGEGRFSRMQTSTTNEAISDIYTKVSENTLLRAVGISMVAGFGSMVILNVARLFFPTFFS